MELKETKTKNVEVIIDVICDCCGESCNVSESKDKNYTTIDKGDNCPTFEFMKLETHWGYDTGKDTQKWTAQVCEKCVDEKLSFIKFKKERFI